MIHILPADESAAYPTANLQLGNVDFVVLWNGITAIKAPAPVTSDQTAWGHTAVWFVVKLT